MASKVMYSVVAAVGIAVASGLAWWYQSQPRTRAPAQAQGSAPAANAPGPARAPAVEAATVQLVKLVDDTQAVGSLRSRQSVVLRPEVSGRVARLYFRDGHAVRKGQLLVQLDDQLPQAQLQQSQAELSIAEANHRRNQELVAQNFISQRSVEESAAALQVAQARVALAQATAARLRLLAPFDGIAGIRNVNVGDYLKDGADIVNIEDLAAMYVDFRLPERFQARIRPGQHAEVMVDALPGRKFDALIQAIDPLVDANGRSVGVRGCIDNRALQLRPGMFARVNAVLGERENARVVPEEAIVPQGGRQYVIKLVEGPDQDSLMTRRVEVSLGLRMPGRVEVLSGLEPGDRIVTAGQQRVQRDETVVRVVESGRPAAAASAPAGAGAPAPRASAPGVQGVQGRPLAGSNPCGAERRPA